MLKKVFLAILITLLTLTDVRAQMLAASTELSSDLLMMPSLGFEMVTGERTTLGISVLGTNKPWGKDVKAIALQPELRYYFSGRPMNHEFIGFGALASNYDITWAGKIYEGSSIGGGLIFGYVLALSKRINLDFHAGFAAIFYRQKEYFVGDHYDTEYPTDGVISTNAHGYTLLPTRIGVSLTYMLK